MRKSMASFLFILAVAMTIVTFSNPTAGKDISWTEAERAFMGEHTVIRLGVDPGFVPFEFIDDNGQYVGIAADYLSLISEKTGLQFEVVKGLTWQEAYEQALSGKLDALPAVGKTEEREEHFLLSQPYYHFKRVIVTRESDTEIASIEDLEGLAVAVQRNSSHHSYLLSYPKINLSLYDSVEAALTAVATGSEKAFLGNIATTNYLIRANALTNLRYVSFEAEKEQALYFAVRRDWPELASIFDKAMATMTEAEKLAIQNKWIALGTDIDYRPLIRVLVIIGSGIAIVMAVSFYWIARLRKEIRQRKQIQKDLEKAKQEADEANAFKSSFLARMSHEIRTPLNAITGMAYLMKRTNLTLTQRMYADRITQASSNMLNIINDILDYSKIEAGKVDLDVTSFSMDQMIQDVVNIVLYKIEEQGIGFKLKKDPLVPNWFIGDSKRIEQILLNLLNNAAKFTTQGEVSLDIRLLATEKEKHHLVFTIKDTGIGMNEDQVKRLFSPFMQGDSSINRRFGGSGLGLSIVKSLLDMMDGKIQVFSTPGEGSTFIMHLPLSVDQERESLYKETLAAYPFKDVRTLVLEKTGANMNLIESYLAALGMHCELTTSRASAMSMLEASDCKFAKPFDLLIVDYDTPPEGGFNFVEAVRDNNKIIKKPEIIMLLPMMREDLFDRLGEYEIQVGIGKPIIPSVLLNSILNTFNIKAVGATQPSEIEKYEPIVLEKSYTVLVVEDNATNQLISQSLLQQIGIESILASDGKQGVELYRQHQEKIALVLMDLHMPVMNGYDAAEAIRKISPSVPIVAMTADVILGVKESCEASGIYHYISKPFDPDQFLRKIRDILSDSECAAPQEPGVLDRTAGLKSMGGRADIYQEVLMEYFDENQETGDKLAHAIKEKRYEDAVQIVHKVRSSSGSIGATSLYELSAKLLRSLGKGKEVEIAFLGDEFIGGLRKLLEEISKEEE